MWGTKDWQKVLQWSPGRIVTFLVAFLGVVLIGIIDELTGIEISLSIIYLAPITFAAWYGGRTVGIVISGLAAAIWLTMDLLGGATYSNRLIPLWNGLVRLGFFLLTTFLLTLVRSLTLNLDALVQRRTAALENEIARRTELELEAAEIGGHEQKRIARELHDQVGGSLAGIAFRAQALTENLERQGRPEAVEARVLVKALNSTMDQVRSFARLLSPPEVPEEGLDRVLAQLGAETETTYAIVCAVEPQEALPALSAEQIRHLYRIAQETIRNAVQHGKARQIKVHVSQVDNSLVMLIANDGAPFDPSAVQSQGMGLRIIQDRVRLLGGNWSVSRDGAGWTVVRCEIPLGPKIMTKTKSDAA